MRLILCILAPLLAVAETKIDSGMFSGLEARALGPATMSGRVAAIDGSATDPRIIYVGAAGGGVWKTTNGGLTFKPVFDRSAQSIGAIAVDPSHPDTVWVGTGESWVRNSTSVGTGIYKSTDAGDNWQLMGLPKSERIAKIVIDPKDSNTVYVAVPGHLWDANEDRGLYKTTDGGKTWTKILSVNAGTGCADVAIDPQESRIVYAAMWQFRRYPWTFKSGGPGSALYRSTDGGITFEKVKAGLPDGELGRIAIAVAPSRPNVVYAAVESKKSALYRSDDLGQTWTAVNTTSIVANRPFYFSLLVVDPKDYNRVYKPGMILRVSKDGGRTFTDVGFSVSGIIHPDHHALWVDPLLPSTIYAGTDGGVFKSTDYGGSWTFLRNLPIGQFYHVTVDPDRPYNVYGGLQDNGSWMGPTQGRGGISGKSWTNVGIGDGFNAFADPSDRNTVYAEWQNGKLTLFDKSTGESKAISPYPRAGEPKYRFNWNTPATVSPTDPKVIYVGAQFLFRSRNRGESWERISDDLTTNNPDKQKQEESGGLTVDNSSAENHCTIYAISESPLNAKTIWVGTDDGNLQLTRDGGKNWKNVIQNVAGAPKEAFVSSIEASRHQPGTAYVTFDNHQQGDMRTYVFRTTDFGRTWTPLATAALRGYAHIIREDLVQPNLLFLGTEFGLFLTIDGGTQWAQFTGKLPNVAVRDLAIHPRESDLIIATHGRGIYVIDDITPLRQITPEVLESNIRILNSLPSRIRMPAMQQEFTGGDEFAGSNSPEAAYISYYLKERQSTGDFKIQVFNSDNQLMTTLPASTRRGLNRVQWAMRMKAPRVPAGQSLETGSLFGPVVPEGAYTAKLLRGDQVYTAQIQLVSDPMLSHSAQDRRLQQQTVLRLYNMLEKLATIATSLTEERDRKQAQLAKLKPGDETYAATKSTLDSLNELNKTLAASKEGGGLGAITGEVRLREEIGELYGDVSRYGGRPTQSQIDRTAVLENQVESTDRKFQSLITSKR